jgi:hypothetical protein
VKNLDNVIAGFVDHVGEIVHLGHEVVVRNDTDDRGQQTEGRVDKGLGDSDRKLDGVRRAADRGQGGERADHPDNRSEKPEHGGNGGDRRKRDQVAFEERRLKTGGFFDRTLGFGQLLLRIELFLRHHKLVAFEARADDVGRRAPLGIAGLYRLIDFAGHEVPLDAFEERGDRRAPVRLAQGKEPLEHKREIHQGQGDQDRHNDTAGVHCTQEIVRQGAGLTVPEVARIAEDKPVDAYRDHGGDHDNRREKDGLLHRELLVLLIVGLVFLAKARDGILAGLARVEHQGQLRDHEDIVDVLVDTAHFDVSFVLGECCVR